MRQLNRQIDDWFMGYKTRAVSPKYSANLGGSGSLKTPRARSFAATGLKSGTGLKNLKAAAAKKPEVMVKIAKRFSNKSNGNARCAKPYTLYFPQRRIAGRNQRRRKAQR